MLTKRKIQKIVFIAGIIIAVYSIIPLATLNINRLEYDENITYFTITGETLEKNNTLLEIMEKADERELKYSYDFVGSFPSIIPMTIFTAQQVMFSLPEGDFDTIIMREYIEYDDKYYYIGVGFIPAIFAQGE